MYENILDTCEQRILMSFVDALRDGVSDKKQVRRFQLKSLGLDMNI